MSRRLAAITAALCSLAIPSFASAEPSAKVDNARAKVAFRLEYTAPEDAYCPTLDELSFTIGGEFGYMVVRPDASAMLRVEIVREEKGFRALVKAPDVSGNAEIWEGQTELQGACRELAYDVASLVGANLGPVAWPTDEPPSVLLAPSEKEEAEIASPPLETPPEASPHPVNILPTIASITPSSSSEASSFHAQAGAFGLVMPYGLTSFAVGGGGIFAFSVSKFKIGAEVRGFVTPASGIGDPPKPGRSTILGGALFPCLIVDPIDLCGVLVVNNIDFELPKTIQQISGSGITAGIGGRILGRWRLTTKIELAGYGEIAGDFQRTRLRVPNVDPTIPGYDWRSPAVRVVLGIGVLTSAF